MKLSKDKKEIILEDSDLPLLLAWWQEEQEKKGNTTLKKASKVKKAAPSHSKNDAMAEQVIAYELITPEIAGDLLSANPHNRRLRDVRVRRYAADMLEGRWVQNAETIKISPRNEIVDGQHRLTAIITSHTSQWMLVARNVPFSNTIDTGDPRIISDILLIRGENNTKYLGAALGFLYRYRTTGVFARSAGSQQLKNYQLEELLDKEPNIKQHITPSSELSKRLSPGQGIFAALRYLLFEIDEDYAYVFWDGLATGVDLKSTSPIYRLRERLAKGSKIKLNHTEIAALTFKAWNAYRKGDKMQVLAWRAAKEPMPRPV